LKRGLFCWSSRWTEVGAFDEYLKIVSGLLAQRGNDLFVGARLGSAKTSADRKPLGS
jgi:hypothetical protein